MPDILIRGMEMPHGKDHITITINANGTVQKLMDMYCKTVGQAVELPPHGDLIERDKAIESAMRQWISVKAYDELLASPVIVPASEEVADGNEP